MKATRNVVIYCRRANGSDFKTELAELNNYLHGKSFRKKAKPRLLEDRLCQSGLTDELLGKFQHRKVRKT